MKIVQLVTQMEAGGAQRIAYLLSDALQARGHEVELWFLYRKRPAYDHLSNTKVLAHSKPSFLLLPRLIRELKNRLELYSPDVLVTHTYYANVLAQVHARLLGIRYRIAVQHNVAKDTPRLARALDCLVGCTDVYTANVAVSDTVFHSFSRYPAWYVKRLHTIGNGIPQARPTCSRNDTRRHWGIPLDKPVMTSVGRLSHVKNQAVLLETLLRLPSVHLVIIGEGELRQQLEQSATHLHVSGRLHMIGEVAHVDTVNIVAASDVFVFPSLSESLGIAVVEAMMCGVPIVASDIPAMHDVLGSHSACFIDPKDPADVAASIRKILTTPVFAKQLSANSFKCAADFTLERMVVEYETLFGAHDQACRFLEHSRTSAHHCPVE